MNKYLGIKGSNKLTLNVKIKNHIHEMFKDLGLMPTEDYFEELASKLVEDITTNNIRSILDDDGNLVNKLDELIKVGFRYLTEFEKDMMHSDLVLDGNKDADIYYSADENNFEINHDDSEAYISVDITNMNDFKKMKDMTFNELVDHCRSKYPECEVNNWDESNTKYYSFSNRISNLYNFSNWSDVSYELRGGNFLGQYKNVKMKVIKKDKNSFTIRYQDSTLKSPVEIVIPEPYDKCTSRGVLNAIDQELNRSTKN